jgi:hypothetical protein
MPSKVKNKSPGTPKSNHPGNATAVSTQPGVESTGATPATGVATSDHPGNAAAASAQPSAADGGDQPPGVVSTPAASSLDGSDSSGSDTPPTQPATSRLDPTTSRTLGTAKSLTSARNVLHYSSFFDDLDKANTQDLDSLKRLRELFDKSKSNYALSEYILKEYLHGQSAGAFNITDAYLNEMRIELNNKLESLERNAQVDLKIVKDFNNNPHPGDEQNMATFAASQRLQNVLVAGVIRTQNTIDEIVTAYNQGKQKFNNITDTVVTADSSALPFWQDVSPARPRVPQKAKRNEYQSGDNQLVMEQGSLLGFADKVVKTEELNKSLATNPSSGPNLSIATIQNFKNVTVKDDECILSSKSYGITTGRFSKSVERKAMLFQDASGKVTDCSKNLTDAEQSETALKAAKMLLSNHPGGKEKIIIRAPSNSAEHVKIANKMYAAILFLQKNNPNLQQIEVVSTVKGCKVLNENATLEERDKFIEKHLMKALTKAPDAPDAKKMGDQERMNLRKFSRFKDEVRKTGRVFEPGDEAHIRDEKFEYDFKPASRS